MNKRSRVKSIARWTAWVLAVLLPAMWVATIWGSSCAVVTLGARRLQVMVGLEEGTIWEGLILYDGHDSTRLWEPHRVATIPDEWWPRVIGIPPFMTFVHVPLWIPWIAICGLLGYLCIDRRIERQRRLRQHCEKCDYPRLGLAPDAPCPECGSLPAPEGSG